MRDTATGIQYSSLSAGIANAVGTHQCQYFRTFSTFFEDYFRGLCCLVWLAGVLDVYPTALYSVIFLIFGDLIRGVDIFIKTSLGCWGWRSFSCTSCSGRGGDSAVFRLASCAHIHSHCLVLLPLMPRFWKGKPEFEERWYGKADRIRKMRSLSVLSLLVVFFPWANSENRRLLKDLPLASVCRWSYADNFASLF